MDTMQKVDKLKALINDGGRFTFARIEAIVEQKMLKRGNPYASATVTKEVTYRAKLNGNYAAMVNAQRVREGKDADFVPSQNWHEKVFDGTNGSIVRKRNNDDGTRYLMAAIDEATVHAYYIDGVRATPQQVEIIKQFRQKSSGAASQGLDKAVIIRTIKVDNINLVKCGDTLIL